ncbi:MAG: hypothetical protein ASARMPREDX12_000803 [Alectoria sarmentosa]|nr:MAG: hypothetical protein ASARMPREDX12_000803 [Alectoria sarmentosa]
MVDSEESRDRELVLRHHPSFSDSGRASVPMWDSSDPDRAPPPLPLNPGSSPATKPTTSKNIAAAAEALTAKARESAYTVNPLPNRSPEKSLIKGQQNKRLQAFQNSNGGLRNSYVDVLGSLDKSPARSPERSPERLLRTQSFDLENRSPERSPTRSGTATPTPTPNGKDAVNLRRPPPKAILGENTPPSATMLALQNMSTPKETDTSLSNITNNSTPNIRSSQNFDAISTQILSLTSIATNLQREMAQLSRRSKDNATDLISLKEATNSRDEDIRKSLRDLVSNLSSRLLDQEAGNGSRAASSYSRGPGNLLDNKPYISPQGMSKSFSLPRIPSPNSALAASIDREISASPYQMEGAASIALLEKILREMGTKEGQERVLNSLSELQHAQKFKESDPMVVKKLEEILTFLKDSTGSSRALVPRRDNGNGVENSPPKLTLDFDPQPVRRVSRNVTPQKVTPQLATAKAQQNAKAADFINEDLQKLLKKMKDSITEGGGMTAEVKAHVRELRGEVLGMGRDIARKLDQAESTSQMNRGDAQGPGREEIAHIVQEGLAELRDHMENLMREKRRQSSSSVVSHHSVDSQEVYTAVKNALSEFPLQQQVALQHPESGIEREEILEAVREAWETYKPEIELQNFGLERDEILQCLKEGLQQYQPKEQAKDLGGASYDEVLDAVREGLQDFKPPAPIETEASMTREEILMTVRECLENFDFPASNVGVVREPEMTRDDVLDAVKEGLSNQAPVSKEIEFNREDLFEAVKAGLEGAPTPMGGVGEKVLDKMEDLIDGMRVEFKQYSVANGGDTEQVLDAMKDGLEVLRADIETYVDRAADVTGKDEIVETIRSSLDHLKIDLEGSFANAPRSVEQNNSGEILDALEKEFEHLRQTIATSMVRSGGDGVEREEILETIREGMAEVPRNLPPEQNPEAAAEIIAVMKDEFEHLRETLGTTLVRGGASADREEVLEAIRDGHESLRAEFERKHERPESVFSGTSELLDALNDGLDGLRVDVERMVNKPIDMTVNYEILETLKEGLANVRADVDRLHTAQSEQRGFSSSREGEVVVADPEAEGLRRNDIGNLEMMITQLRIKVEALDNMPPPPPPAAYQSTEGAIAKEHIEDLEAMVRDVQASVADIVQRERVQNENNATKDDTEAIETLLRNTKAKLDEIGSSDSEGLAKVAHFESLESILNETRDAVQDFGSDGASKKDIDVLEALLKEVRAGLEDMRERNLNDDNGNRVSKTDIEALGTLCMDTKTLIAELELPNVENIPTRTDMEMLTGLIHDFTQQADEKHELTAQAFEARKIEHGGIADKIEDVKLIFEDVREELKARINDSHHSVQDLAKALETVGETIMAADSTATVQELVETVKREFRTVHSASASGKEETEQNHTILLDKYIEVKDAVINDLNTKIDERFDEIMTKYDDAQLAAQEKERALGGKDVQQTEALNATKTAAEDLRLLVDALGSTVTESCDRMSEDSKTVFSRVEEVSLKLDDLLALDGRSEHQATRAEISKTLTGVEAVHAHASEYHPKILDAVRDVLGIVGQHYEQTRVSAEEIKTSVKAIPAAIPLPAIAPSLPLPEMIREAPIPEKYDDTGVHAKLDHLVAHATEAGKSVAEVAMLEQIREQVAATASQVDAFVAAQQAAIAETNDSRAKEAEELAIALEKRTAQKENVEAEIVRLSCEKEDIAMDVQELFREKEELSTLKSKMQADLSSLETALQIRREELHVMEARAEGLERRILDGVLDHSRSLLTTSRPQSSLKDMNLKRVVSTASNATVSTRASTVATTLPSKTNSAVSSGVGMALKRRPPPRASGTSTSSGQSDRRILSLSTLGANKGAAGERSMVLANPSISGGTTKASGWGAGGLKRSHSVKSNFPVRKTSWNGTKTPGMYADEGIDEGDKENSVLDEEDEEDVEGSEAGTERRTSYSGTYSGTGSYGDGSTIPDDDKRTSYAASTIGTVGTRGFEGTEDGEDESQLESAHEEEGERDEEGLHLGRDAYQGDAAAAKGEISNAGEMIVFGPPTDSGIGTDIPTAQLEGGTDYFKRY